jgi:hypothetical protein
MARKTEKLSAAQQTAIKWLHSQGAAKMGALGHEIGKWAAELVAELADAKREAEHWKAAFETVRDEIKVLAAVAIKQQHDGRLVITRKELAALEGKELHVGTPEPGVRVYEVRERAPNIRQDVSRILRPH